MNRLIRRCSFGLITTDKQTTFLKLGIVVVGVMWLLGQLFFSVNQVEPQPLADLIHANQPIDPL